MTLVWGAILMCFGFVKWGPLLETGLTVASLPFGSLLGLFLLGTLDRRATATGALIGMFAGLATILCVWRYHPHRLSRGTCLIGAVDNIRSQAPP